MIKIGLIGGLAYVSLFDQNYSGKNVFYTNKISMIDNFYKDAFNDKLANKNDIYFHFIDYPLDTDIINYKFLAQENGKPVQELTVSMAIESLRKELARERSDYMLSNLNESLILQNLKRLNEIMRAAESKFGTENNLSDFPYIELSNIIVNSKDNETIIFAIECLKTAIRFDHDSIESKITEEAVTSLGQLMKDENIDLSRSAINIIGYFNQFSQNLCEEFCSSGLIAALIKHLPQPYAIFTIQTSMVNCKSEYSLKFLFLLCKSVLKTEDELITNYFFHGISIFIERFGYDSIPDQISDEEIDPDSKYECKKIIFQLLKYHMFFSVRFQLVLSLVEFCSLIPEQYPVNIFPKLLEYLIDKSLIEDYPILVESVSSLITQSYNRCKNFIQRDLLIDLYKSIEDDSIDFQISFSYAKLIVEYHQIAHDDFDINIVELCARYICCSDNLFSWKCIKLINEIINQFSIHGQLEQMISCIHVLNESRENLETRIEDPELNSNNEMYIRSILSILDKYKAIFQESEEN